MARKITKIDKKVLEDIVKESIIKVGLKGLNEGKAALLLRLIISGIGNYFFISPDTEIDVGFIKFKKNPEKDELFTVDILRNGEEGIINADTLYRYYKGELAKEGELKKALEGFVGELLAYSQEQETSISRLTSRLSNKKRKGD